MYVYPKFSVQYSIYFKCKYIFNVFNNRNKLHCKISMQLIGSPPKSIKTGSSINIKLADRVMLDYIVNNKLTKSTNKLDSRK
jgi:hypothetical protein